MRDFTKEYIRLLVGHPDNPANKQTTESEGVLKCIGDTVDYKFRKRCHFCFEKIEKSTNSKNSKLDGKNVRIALLRHYSVCTKDCDTQIQCIVQRVNFSKPSLYMNNTKN